MEKKSNQIKMKKLSKLLIDLLLVVCLCACVSNAQKIQKQLEIGNKYLVELDYEQAILAFNEVIEIDPKNTDAYLGLGDAYYGEAKNAGDYSAADTLYTNAAENYGIVMDLTENGAGTTVSDKSLEEINQNVKEIMAELYVEWSDLALKEGDIDHASKILEDGYLILGDDEILEKSQTISDIKYAENFINELDVSSEQFAISSKDDYKKLKAIAEKFGGKYISSENGQGFGLYNVDGHLYVFRGSFKNGLREGPGLLAFLWLHDEAFVKCDWKEDVPFGEAEYYEKTRWDDNSNNILNGEFQLVNGLYDGEGTISSAWGSRYNFSVNQGNVVNHGYETPDMSHFATSESGNFSVENSMFELTRGMPGYADCFSFFY